MSGRIRSAGSMLIVGLCITACSSSPNPDPRGLLLRGISDVTGATPPQAVAHVSRLEPRSDICESGHGAGYDPATVQVEFTVSATSAGVRSWVASRMQSLGWTEQGSGGPWVKRVLGESAYATLSVSTARPGRRSTTRSWSLVSSVRSKVSPMPC